jgi:heavy metal translocating P-type ATPase
VNLDGILLVEATGIGEDTALAQIARLVAEAQGTKAPVQHLADRVAGIFVPVVLAVAALTALAWAVAGGSIAEALEPAVAVLIIACPCALGLATPAALMVGTGRGAQEGILFRGADVLERSRAVDTVVFDKTGTLTQGRMRLVAVGGEPEALAMAAAVEADSEHPIARAVAGGAAERGVIPHAATAFRAEPGRGARATVEGIEVLVGSRGYLQGSGLETSGLLGEAEQLEATGHTVAWVGWDGRARGVLAVADAVRPEAATAVADLRRLGVEVVMITGDGGITARAVADPLGIERVLAGVPPAGKVDEIRALQEAGRVVAMVGDGLNDGPALAGADLGIAIGTGTDVAIEASDITLLSADVEGVGRALRLARRTFRTIGQNLWWAFGYNVAAIPLAAAGVLDPVVAAAAMALSSVSVVANSLRLRRRGAEHALPLERSPGDTDGRGPGRPRADG